MFGFGTGIVTLVDCDFLTDVDGSKIGFLMIVWWSKDRICLWLCLMIEIFC